MPEKVVRSTDFSSGWVTVLPAHLLDDGATPNVENVDFSESFGRLTKRKGYTLTITANAGGSTKVTGLYEYVQEDGDSFLIGSSVDDVYNITAPGTWTSILNAGALNAANVNFTTFDDLLIIVSENLTTSKWTGSGSAASLGGTPPSNVRYVETHKRRVFMASSSAGRSRLHYSAQDNPEDWTTVDDAGSADIGIGDGDVITGIKSVGSCLLIFKKRSTWAMFGTSPANFSYRKISPSVGCVAPKSIVACDKFVIFLSSDGVYAANGDGVTLLSYNIRPTIDGVANATKAIACAGKIRNQYWLAVDTNSDGVNDEVWYLDFVLGCWGRYTNKKENVFFQKQDGSLISGGADTDVIRTHDVTELDNATAITMTWDTKDFDLDLWEHNKVLKDVMIVAAPIAAKTLTVTHLIDGVAQGTTLSMSLAASGAQDKVYLIGRHFPPTAYSRFFRLRLTNAEASATVKVYGYSMNVEVRERQNG